MSAIILENLDSDVAPCCYNCAGCNHYACWSGTPMMRPDELLSDLRLLASVLHARQFTLIGGEPTLNPWLVELMQAVLESGISDTLQVSTNGSRLNLMPEAFWQALRPVDRMHLTLYPRSIGDNLALAQAKAEQYHFRLHTPSHPFHKCLVAQPRTAEAALENYQGCPYRVECWQVYHGFLYRCPAGARLPGRFLGLPETIDGLALNGDLTEASVQAFIDRAEPSHSCYLCDYKKEYIDWHECANEEEWRRDSTRS
jgi:hypothetical protein